MNEGQFVNALVFVLFLQFQIVMFFVINEDVPPLFVIISQGIIYVLTPIYMIYKICQTRGRSIQDRLKQLTKPQDWYPYDLDNRRFYEEIMGISEMSVLDQNNIT